MENGTLSYYSYCKKDAVGWLLMQGLGKHLKPEVSANDASESEVVSFISNCLALFFCVSREKDNEEEDAKDENGNDEKAAGILNASILRHAQNQLLFL